jgi:hypothetical protein
MKDNERCPECGSWGEECLSEKPVVDCGCARCLRFQRDEARATVDIRDSEIELLVKWCNEQMESLRAERHQAQAEAKSLSEKAGK